MAAADIGKSEIWNYELLTGNAVWRIGLVLIIIIAALAIGRIIQFFIESFANRRQAKLGKKPFTIFLKCLEKPVSVFVFAIGLRICKLCLVFEDTAADPVVRGISAGIGGKWVLLVQAIIALAVVYALFKMVDIIEYYLLKWTGKTETKLDDMLVPVVRKSLRVTIAIMGAIFIVDNILKQDVGSILLGAGVGGIAIALAAKDTIANFFGSVTIFADRPFQIDEIVKIGDHKGPVEEVGFRSTKIRTLAGHLVTVPNSVIVNTGVENIGKRPFIRRTSNITITYDSGQAKTQKAVEIIRDVLANTPEVNTDPEKPPRVYFSDFNDWSLNIYMSYWVKPPDYWLYHEVNERVNVEIMKAFEAEKIEFAFPTQTLYVKKDGNS